MRRIGMLASGGSYQALNATMRDVAKSLYNMFDGVEIVGFEDGYEEFIYADYQIMKSLDFSGVLTRGNTILGTSRQPFKLIRTPDENGLDKVEAMKHTYEKLKLSYFVALGRNGNQETANMLSEEGLSMISPLKTIDGDLWDTDMTFGFQNTVDVVTNATNCVHVTAAPHGRVFIVEVMGHKVGWLTLYAGLAGGTGIILLPEISYDINIVCDALTERSKVGGRFSILAVAEGAISEEDAKMSRRELKEKKRSGVVYPSMAYETGAKIQEVIDSKVRVTVPGHMQHGGEPCTYDRVLAIRLGAAVARLIAEERYGYMVTVKNNDIAQMPLSEVVGRLGTMDPECSMIKKAKMVGTSFGDE